MPWSRVLLALFVAYVAANALHVGYVVHHEPFAFDAWNVAIDSGAKPITFERFLQFWWDQYTSSNPRLGQPLTYLTYKLEWFAEIATPLAHLALSLAITVLGLGRWPRRGRDLALWAIAIGFSWFVLPQIGRNMFCRAYAANYIYTAAIQLWFLVPLRLVRSGDASLHACVAYGIAGIFAGACNEHTGPTFLAFLLGYAWWLRRRGGHPRLVLAGFLGMTVGFALLFFAPGQDSRYGEIAQQVSLLTRMLQRGITGNLDIVRDYIAYGAPLLALLVIALLVGLARKPPPTTPPPLTDDATRAARRRAVRFIAVAFVMGLTMAMTLFVSPKLGSRFYIVSLSLLLAGFLALADAVLVTRRQLVPFVVLAIAASAYAAVRTVPLYRQVSAQGAARMAALDASKRGDIFVADAFGQVDETWWYIGDDFRDFQKRELVQKYFALSRVFFRGYDLKGPLGMAGVRFAPRYRVAGDDCDRQYELFDTGVTRGFDIAGVHRSTAAAVELLRGQLGAQQLARFELGVVFIGAPPPLPRPHLVVARWSAGRIEGYTAKISRRGRSTTREIKLGKELAGKPFEIYIVQVGGEAKKLGTTDGAPLRYVPWRSGVYWVLACDAKPGGTECFVIAATRQSA
ncbi:MAG: hypothetical protein H0T89_14365 [Deltaproteobacteria bacterium]|nr:hypothetical protein [Deltaproteobacteria bacterium]MDQ3296070.1 DUF6056 family protein [Myxococcota bacterium]